MAQEKGGLEGVVVADITTSLVNGEEGKLIYSGYNIEDLAENALFEEVVYLLWHNELPTQKELDSLTKKIAESASLPDDLLNLLKTLPKDAHPMAVLRTSVSMLAHYDPDSENLTDQEVAHEKAARLMGQMATATAAWARIREGRTAVAPRADLNLAENFVYMLSGENPDPTIAKAFNVYLVLLAEHGMNASTFTSRVVTATGADMHSAVVAAMSALKGPSHGGANTEAMKMFKEIDTIDNVTPWFQAEVKSNGRRIMGIGHRVYKAPDPRAAVLKKYSDMLANSAGNTRWLEIAENLEQVALADDYFKERQLFPNVDYYSAILLYTLGLDLEMFTALFAMSRIAGWSAHIVNQMGGRLIRPRANYIGDMDLVWKPIDQR